MSLAFRKFLLLAKSGAERRFVLLEINTSSAVPHERRAIVFSLNEHYLRNVYERYRKPLTKRRGSTARRNTGNMPSSNQCSTTLIDNEAKLRNIKRSALLKVMIGSTATNSNNTNNCSKVVYFKLID